MMFIDIGIRKERIYGEKEFVWEMPHTTLSRQLKTLENEGLIIRREYRQILIICFS